MARRIATIKRSPRVGDVVTAQDRLYVVTAIYRQGGLSRRIDFYEVASVDHPGRPNTFHPHEVSVIASDPARAARARYTANGGTLRIG